VDGRARYLKRIEGHLTRIREEHNGRPGWLGKNERFQDKETKVKRKAGRPRVGRGKDADIDTSTEGDNQLDNQNLMQMDSEGDE
jgi:hypothetical protein